MSCPHQSAILISRISTLLAAADEATGSGVGFLPPSSCGRDLEVSVGVAPKQGDTSEPVFCVDQPANASKIFRRQDADGCREFRAGDLSADGAGSDFDLRVVADALVLSQLAAGHEVEFVIVFGKPNGRVHGNARLPEGGEADVTLAVNFCGDGSHGDIVNTAGYCSAVSRNAVFPGPGEGRCGHVSNGLEAFCEERAQMTNQVDATSLTIANG